VTEPKRENSIRGLPQWHAVTGRAADDPPPGEEGGGDQQLNVLLLAAALGAFPAAWSVATHMVWVGKPRPLLFLASAAVGALGAFAFARWQRHPVSGLLPGLLGGAGSYALTAILNMDVIQLDLK
jgi:hypothetical protein